MGRKKSILNVLLCNIIIFSLLSAVHVMQDEAFAELKKKDLTRINEDGSVEMRVTYMNPLSKMDTAELVFEVRMNTHTVDLDAYKLEELSILKDEKGMEHKPLGWFNPGGGGHHRFGTLKFANRHKEGGDIINKDTKELTLVIKDIDNIKERRFQWTFPLE